jgi:hypothetical protein
MVTGRPAAPDVSEMLAGSAVSVKSAEGGGADTFKATLTVCVIEPELPVNVTVALPLTALAFAVKVTFCGVPGVRVSVDGAAVTPAGKPRPTAMFTLPLKPFTAIAVTAIGSPFAPAVSDRVVGAATRIKSGEGGGGSATVKSRTTVCVTVPAVPMKLPMKAIAPMLAGAFATAVRVMFCGVPGVRARVDGVAVTPAGKPRLSETFTVPLKPFKAVAVTATGSPFAPAVSVKLDGAIDKAKSGAGVVAAVTLTASVTVFVSEPEVPVNVMVALLLGAFGSAVRVTFCDVPGVRFSVEGVTVTPAGSPATATLTIPLNPFVPATLTVTPCADPAAMGTVSGATVNVKSCEDGSPPPPVSSGFLDTVVPQATSTSRKSIDRAETVMFRRYG